ncbi:MAG: phosphatidylglycerophosphatase A [Pyrinomonadaceae bacterium]|nr:phosphatidylglycerophosphatase A [Pyrinomonadaceae bacterium]
MKTEIPSRKPNGFLDYLSLAVTTCGVGYIPLAPGTWGSAVGVLVFLGVGRLEHSFTDLIVRYHGWTEPAAHSLFYAMNAALFVGFVLLGVWAAGRATELLGNLDPSQAVVDEVIGQLIVFAFVPISVSAPLTNWPIVIAGFLLFRLFDVWKPYPIDYLQGLPTGLGVCADDILAGCYAGAVLAIIHALMMGL